MGTCIYAICIVEDICANMCTVLWEITWTTGRGPLDEHPVNQRNMYRLLWSYPGNRDVELRRIATTSSLVVKALMARYGVHQSSHIDSYQRIRIKEERIGKGKTLQSEFCTGFHLIREIVVSWLIVSVVWYVDATAAGIAHHNGPLGNLWLNRN